MPLTVKSSVPRSSAMTFNLDKCDRQHPVGMNSWLRGQQKRRRIGVKEAAFFGLISSVCRAEKSKNVCPLKSGSVANECQAGQPGALNPVAVKVVGISGRGAMAVVEGAI